MRRPASSCSRGASGSRGTKRSQPNGRYTTGNSRPLLRWTVTIWTAAASESRRRLRSSPTSACASSMRCRSHSTSAAGPRCASTVAACSACPTWRRSVSRRSPPATASRRAGSPVPAVTASSSAATPRSRSRPAQRRSAAPSSSRSPSAPSAQRSVTVRPKKQVSAASRIRIGRGCSRARRRVSHSRAAGVPKTLAVPESTAGTPTAASASRMTVPWSFVRTSTATSPGCSGEPFAVAPLARSVATSTATSRATQARADAASAWPRPLSASPSRDTTRIRSGAPIGAPVSRDPGCAGSTGRTTIRASPSAAPRNTAASARSTPASLRQFRARVAWASACPTASR